MQVKTEKLKKGHSLSHTASSAKRWSRRQTDSSRTPDPVIPCPLETISLYSEEHPMSASGMDMLMALFRNYYRITHNFSDDSLS